MNEPTDRNAPDSPEENSDKAWGISDTRPASPFGPLSYVERKRLEGTVVRITPRRGK